MLERLVQKYGSTPFRPKMNFYREDGIKISEKFTFTSAKDYLDDYLSYYKKLDELTFSIVFEMRKQPKSPS